ncbi:35446_t:CDS:2, partial [Racocetra persica]
NAKSSDPINFYGITYYPSIEKYVVVIEYFEYGDLRDYLKSNFSDLEWKSKLYLLDSIARGLSKLHYFEKSIHKDFHTGNILQTRQIDNEGNEIIRSKIYKPIISKESKEEICKGVRPECPEGTPECYVQLVNECLDTDPEKRPTMDVIERDIAYWKDICNGNIEELSDEELEIRKAFEAADKQIPDIATNAYTNVHPKTAWKSQYLKLPKLPVESEETQENHEAHHAVETIETVQDS